VLWAGLVPEDLDYRPHLDYFSNRALHFVYGTNDPFITDERLREHEQLLREQQLDFQVHTFDGEHTIDRSALQKLAAEIYR
jgi:predicted esterase